MQQTPSKLTLDRWAQIIGYSPLHFWGVDGGEWHHRGMACGKPIFQYDWQDADRIGRDEIGRAIAEAEADLERLLRYRLMPSWEEDEWVSTQRPYRSELFNLNNADVRGFATAIQPQWGYMVSGGIRSVETLDSGATVTYDNDGHLPTTYKNRATVTLLLTEEIPDCEVAVFYPDHAGDERWRIRPVEVFHTAGLTYTVRFRRELAVLEDHLESYDLETLRGVDGGDDANFLSEVAVCRVYNDPQQQATFLWESNGSPCGCSGAGCSVCGYGTQTGCFLLRGDPRLSLVVAHPATWDSDALAFNTAALAVGRQPDIVRLWYYAGWQDKSADCPVTELDDDWARTVAYLAASKLDREICACSQKSIGHWRTDLAFSSGVTEMSSHGITQSDLDNPLGTTRGAVMAWKRIKGERGPKAAIGRGIIA